MNHEGGKSNYNREKGKSANMNGECSHPHRYRHCPWDEERRGALSPGDKTENLQLGKSFGHRMEGREIPKPAPKSRW